MKKIISIATLSCLAFTSIGHATALPKPEGWYLKGSWENFIETDYNRTVVGENNPAVGASFGYKKDALRAEGQYRYFREQNVRLHDLGINGFFDIDNSTPFSPYIGVGLHQGFLRANGYSFSDSKSDFYALGIAGLRAYLTTNFAVDLNYSSNLGHLSEGGSAALGFVYHF